MTSGVDIRDTGWAVPWMERDSWMADDSDDDDDDDDADDDADFGVYPEESLLPSRSSPNVERQRSMAVSDTLRTQAVVPGILGEEETAITSFFPVLASDVSVPDIRAERRRLTTVVPPVPGPTVTGLLKRRRSAQLPADPFLAAPRRGA